MIPKKPAPDLIRGGNRFSEKIMLKHMMDGQSRANTMLASQPVNIAIIAVVRP